MGRTTGAKNIVVFDKRKEIATSSSKSILHLAAITGSPLGRFQDVLHHQEKFLDWIYNRHEKLKEQYSEIRKLKKEPGSKRGPHGPKDTTFSKYWWYAEQLVLLEAINNFEVFYKRTFIELATVLQDLIPVERVTGEVEARILWSQMGKLNVPSLVFESKLFHDHEKINEATKMLFGPGKVRYNAGDGPRKERIRCLRAIYQIRHTLSHNAAVVTASDATKFKTFGFDVKKDEILDPTKEHMSTEVFRFMQQEAKEFTDWLRDETIEFLKNAVAERALEIAVAKRACLKKLLGGGKADWAKVKWI